MSSELVEHEKICENKPSQPVTILHIPDNYILKRDNFFPSSPFLHVFDQDFCFQVRRRKRKDSSSNQEENNENGNEPEEPENDQEALEEDLLEEEEDEEDDDEEEDVIEVEDVFVSNFAFIVVLLRAYMLEFAKYDPSDSDNFFFEYFLLFLLCVWLYHVWQVNQKTKK